MNEYIKLIEETRNKVCGPLCKCMYRLCDKEPIKSHAFQKNGILKKIAEKGKVMSFEYKHLYSLSRNESPIAYEERGIGEKNFWFYGFCSVHDKSLFLPIEESEEKVDWRNERNQYLLAYRTVCRELYIDLKVERILRNCLGFYDTNVLLANLSNIKSSITKIVEYKNLFENGIFNEDYSKYYFKIVELPFKLDLCLASPIAISDELNGFCFNNESNHLEQVNVVNIFPYKNRTMIILGFLEGSPNKWVNEMYENLRSDDIDDVCISLQDFLFRSEFHCISKKLYTEIKDELPLFFQEWNDRKCEYNAKLNYKSNIFKKPIMKSLGYNDDEVI